MKLIEKLAREHLEAEHFGTVNCEPCFQAGFRKARELAAAIATEAEGLDFGISELGEGEVQEKKAQHFQTAKLTYSQIKQLCHDIIRDYNGRDGFLLVLEKWIDRNRIKFK